MKKARTDTKRHITPRERRQRSIQPTAQKTAPTQEAYESPKVGHGYLTYALIEEGLTTGVAATQDGTVTLSSWLDYAAERVPQIVSERLGGPKEYPVLFSPRGKWGQAFIIAKIEKERSDSLR